MADERIKINAKPSQTFALVGDVDDAQIIAISETIRNASAGQDDCLIIRCDQAKFFDVRWLTALSELRCELAAKNRRVILQVCAGHPGRMDQHCGHASLISRNHFRWKGF